MGIYVGIDPGKKGFTAEIDAETGYFLRADVQPLIGKDTKGDNFDYQAMVRTALRWKEEGVLLAVLEELHPMGGSMGTPQTHFYQGMSYAIWKGILAALKIPFICVPKSSLKKTMNIKTPSRIPKDPPLPKKATKAEKKAWNAKDRARLTRYQNQVKAEAIKVCTTYFPDVDLRRTPACKGPDDNKCEAMLYSVYASKEDHHRNAAGSRVPQGASA
jgi:hypothetical protein